MAGRSRHPVAAVLLAAGSSRRFGPENKLLQEIGGIALVRRVALVLAASRVHEIVVVTGPDREAVRAALGGIAVTFAHNAGHAGGMGGSVATGIRAVGANNAGALVCPGDMPGLDAPLIDRLIDAFEASGATRIVYPVLAGGGQRNPVIWPRRLFARLEQLSGEGGAKPILAEHAAECTGIEIVGDARFDDIDTAEELEGFRRLTRR